MKKSRISRSLVYGLLSVTGVIFAASIPGCSGCGGSALTKYVPHDALVVVVVPSIKKAVEQQSKLLAKFKDNTAINKAWEQYKGEAAKELGFDPYKPESMKAKGFDPAGGIVASVSAKGKDGAVVLGVSDQKAMEKFLRGMATKMVGASATFKTKDMDGVKVTIVSRQGSDKERLAWGYHKKNVIICGQAEDKEMAKYVVKLTKLEKTIKKNKNFSDLSGKAGKAQAYVYFDGASVKQAATAHYEKRLKRAEKYGFGAKYIKREQEVADGLLNYFRGGVMGLEFSGKGVVLRTYLGVPKEKAAKIAEFLQGKGSAPDFGEYILPSAITVARGSVDIKKMMDWMVEMVPDMKKEYYHELQRFERRTKIDIEKDVYDLLAGRYALGFFAPPADAFKGDKRMEEKVMKAVGGVLLVQVTDDKKASDMLATMEKAMTMRGMDIQIKTEGERKNYFFRLGSEKIAGWTVVKKMLVVTSAAHLEKTVKLIEKGGDNVLDKIESSAAKSTFKSKDGLVWYFNLNQLGTLLGKASVPTEYKMQYKMFVEPAAKVLTKFSDLSYTMEAKKDGLVGEITVTLK